MANSATKGSLDPLITLGYGLASVLLSALIYAAIESAQSFSIFGFTAVFLPVGAILLGYLAASGVALSMWTGRFRPARAASWLGVICGLTSFVALLYLSYRLNPAIRNEGGTFVQYVIKRLLTTTSTLRVSKFRDDTVQVDWGAGAYVATALKVAGCGFGGWLQIVLLGLRKSCPMCGGLLVEEAPILRSSDQASALHTLQTRLLELESAPQSADEPCATDRALNEVKGFGGSTEAFAQSTARATARVTRCRACGAVAVEITLEEYVRSGQQAVDPMKNYPLGWKKYDPVQFSDEGRGTS